MSNKSNTAASSGSTSTGAASGSTSSGGQSGGATTTPAEAPKPDPFANLPTVQLAETTVVDLSTAKIAQGPERKYAKVAEGARGVKSPMVVGWKHERAVFIPGTNRKELRAGSVHGTIQEIVNKAGRSGINAIDLVVQLRQRQVGNARSVYCKDGSEAALPPVGWAEGWINSAVTRNIVGVSPSKQAPLLRPEPAPAAATGEGSGSGQKAAA